MKFKTKDTTMEIQLVLLNQFHFLACMYIIMWATMKEEYAYMIGAKLDEFCRLDWNTLDFLVIKELICSF